MSTDPKLRSRLYFTYVVYSYKSLYLHMYCYMQFNRLTWSMIVAQFHTCDLLNHILINFLNLGLPLTIFI